MAHISRTRLGSISDNSAPSSSSDTSEVPESAHDLELAQQVKELFFSSDVDALPDSGDITENERVQVESFLSGLGTEVSTEIDK